jgi:uncharacterized YccA/Bax inhibitor family protein
MSEERSVQKSGSPALGARFLREKAAEGEAVFTPEGAVHKAGILTTLVILFAALSWMQPGTALAAILPAALVGLVLAFIIIFVPSTAPYLAILYAMVEGVVVGGVSLFYEWKFPGIVFNAAAGTLGILAVMVVGYSTGLFKFGARGRAIIVACTMGLALTYLVALVLHFFGIQVGFIHDSGPWGIAFSVFALVIASLNFSLDFDFIGAAREEGLAKRMEWYAAFSVLVTLIWVYFEMLRLLSKLRKR